MIIDCTQFFQELDLYEVRLKLLENVVDLFILIESNLTHAGDSKPYLFQENIERFKRWKNQIVYLPIEQSTEGLHFAKREHYSVEDGSWFLEQQNRMGLLLAQDLIPDDSIVLLSDCDEFPSVDILKQKERLQQSLSQVEALSFVQQFCAYYMNCKNVTGPDVLWNGTVATTGRVFKEKGPQYLRDNRNHFSRINNAGYHFSFLGQLEKVRSKITSFAHTEFNRPDITSDENILQAINEGKDVLNRPGVTYQFVSLDEYPVYLRELMVQYPQFIKQL